MQLSLAQRARIRFHRSVVVIAAILVIAAQGPQLTAVEGDWVALDVSSGRALLDSLTTEETVEQLRDWALLSAYSLSAPANAPHRDALLSVMATRVDALSSLYFRRAGETRGLAISETQFLALVPDGTAGAARSLQLGRLLDEERAAKGRVPAIVVVYEYRIAEDRSGVSIRAIPQVAGSSFFTEAEGYYERSMATLADLDAFLALNLDLTHSRLEAGRLTVGGRRMGSTLPRLMTREDLAALKQADLRIEDEVRAQLRKRGLRAEYDRLVRKQASLIVAGTDTADNVLPYTDLMTVIKRVETANPYDTFEAEAIDAIMRENPPSLGFSLDPRVNYQAIADDLERALRGDPAFYDGWYLEGIRNRVVEHLLLDKRELDFARFLSQLRRPSAASETQAAGETSLRTLIGLDAGAMRKPAAAKRSAAPALDASEVAEIVRQSIVSTKQVVDERSEELNRVVEGLRRADTAALFDLERYLNADTVGLTMRPGAAPYRVRDLQRMLHEAVAEDLPVDGVYGPKTTAAVRAFQEAKQLKATGLVDDETWAALLQDNEEVASAIAHLREALRDIENRNNYQCGRYDGRLAGTRVGMTSYYTDLLMKLWGFAGDNETPPIPGFVSETQFQVSPAYWEHERKFTSTRGWLGPRFEGFKVHGGNRIMFAPVATRLYNASSNPLISGAEVPANFSSDRFSSWWNAHYLQVADYEPEYHRLNEIMKWIVVLNTYEEATVPVFASLLKTSVERGYRFDSWWQANRGGLRVAPIEAFRKVATEPTECIDILQSKPYLAMDNIYRMSGGVTYPSKAAVRAKVVANEARADVPALLKASTFDVPGITVGPKSLSVSIREGELTRGTFELASGSPVAQFRPNPERLLQGPNGALSAREIRLSYERAPNGALEIRGVAGSESLFSVSFRKAADGRGVAVNYAEGDLVRHVRDLKRLESADASAQLFIPERNQLLIRGSNDKWTITTFDPLEAGARRPSLPPGAREPVFRSGVGARPVTVRSLTPEEFAAETKGLAAERVSPPHSFEPSARVRTELVTAMPDVGAEVTVRIGTIELRGRANGAELYIPRTSDAGRAGRTIADAMPARELRSMLSSLEKTPEGVVTAMRGGHGQLVLGAKGGRIDLSAQELRVLDDVLPAKLTGRRVLLRNESGARITALGDLELPRTLLPNDVSVATKAIRLIDGDVELADALGRLGRLDAKTLDEIAGLTPVRRPTYVEFRVAPELQRGEILADLRVDPAATDLMIRRGPAVEFRAIDAAKAKRLSAEYQYIDDVMNPARAVREGRVPPDPTLDELIRNTKGVYDHLREFAASTRAERIITKEGHDVSNATIWALHRGDARVRFFRDQPDIGASLRNVRRPVTVAPGRSIFAITADVGVTTGVGRVPALAERIARRLPIEASVSFDTFQELLADPEVSQIILVAREHEDGLVFSDRWVSFRELELRLRRRSALPLLVLVSNGGTEVREAFSEAVPFNRILSLQYALGQLDAFENALESVVRFFETTTATTVTVSKDDFEALTAAEGWATAALSAARRVKGGEVDVDVPALLGGMSKLPGTEKVTILARLMARVPPSPAADVDRAAQQIEVERLRASSPNLRRARAELGALPQIKYE